MFQEIHVRCPGVACHQQATPTSPKAGKQVTRSHCPGCRARPHACTPLSSFATLAPAAAPLRR
eukprot:12839866-Prorocentrum_lima.AAC.1